MKDSPVLALLLLIILIVSTNAVMFAVVRGLARGDTDWLRRLRESLGQPMDQDRLRREQLRRAVAALPTGKRAHESQATDADVARPGDGDPPA